MKKGNDMEHWVVVSFFSLVCYIIYKTYKKPKNFTYYAIKLSELNSDEIVVIDLETTGLDALKDKIIEIAALKYNFKTEQTTQKSWIINIKKRLPKEIKALTNISDEMIKSGVDIKSALQELSEFIDDNVIACHNAKFDAGFLLYNYHRYLKRKFKNAFLCTFLSAKEFLPYQKSYSLANLARELNLSLPTHRASDDALATLELLKLIIQIRDDEILDKKQAKYIKTFARTYRGWISVVLYLIKADARVSPKEKDCALALLLSFDSEKLLNSEIIASFLKEQAPPRTSFEKYAKQIAKNDKEKLKKFSQEIADIKKELNAVEKEAYNFIQSL